MMKTGLIKGKIIENEEIIMSMTKITTTVIMKIIITLRMIVKSKIGNHIKI